MSGKKSGFALDAVVSVRAPTVHVCQYALREVEYDPHVALELYDVIHHGSIGESIVRSHVLRHRHPPVEYSVTTLAEACRRNIKKTAARGMTAAGGAVRGVDSHQRRPASTRERAGGVNAAARFSWAAALHDAL